MNNETCKRHKWGAPIKEKMLRTSATMRVEHWRLFKLQKCDKCETKKWRPA